jgi:hypothetical protein
VSFYVCTDLRDLKRLFTPTVELVALTSEFPQASRALQGRYRLRKKQTLGQAYRLRL